MNICAAMKVILVTGSTDGIGLEAAKLLLKDGHRVLIHGRNPAKVQAVSKELGTNDFFVADLADFDQVEGMAKEINSKFESIDVIVNNAGVFKTSNPQTKYGLDARFVVNTISPYLLTKRLLAKIPSHGRIVNLSSAAQAPVDDDALAGTRRLDDSSAYAQSKLAITMWSYALSSAVEPTVVSVNPASLLGTNMVQAAYGIPGKDIQIGAEIIRKAAVSSKFRDSNGRYFDNDHGRFRSPHPDAENLDKSHRLVANMDAILAKHSIELS